MGKHREQKTRKWFKRHIDDPYVKAAKKAGLRSRAAFKLEWIHQKTSLITPSMRVLDLGAAPGGWSQEVMLLSKGKAKLVSVDLLLMQPLQGAQFIQGDFTQPKTQEAIANLNEHKSFDLIISDMAPNFSGIEIADQLRSMDLAHMVLDFSLSWLAPQGSMLLKVFHGSGFDDFVKKARVHFEKVSILKPDSSRKHSRENYILASKIKKSS